VNRFNLTFWGEILPGKDPQQVKSRFAKLFDIKDPVRLEHFFSGDTIILRRNLDRKVAGEYYHKLHKLGVEAELVKVDAVAAHPEPPATETTETTDPQEPAQEDPEAQWEIARRQAEQESLRRRQLEQHKQQQEKLARQQAEVEHQRQLEDEEKARLNHEAELERARLEEIERAAEAARKKQAAEEKSRQQAQEAERIREAQEQEMQQRAMAVARRKAEEEKQRQKRAVEEQERLRQEEEKRLRKEEERRLKAEEAARKKVQADAERKRKEEEARRRREEAEARKKAEEREARQRQAAEAARKKAEEEAEKQRREKEAEQRRIEAEKERQRKAEEAARKKAAQAEAKRKREEEAARRKAEAEKERQRKAEEAARKKAAQEEAKRKREEETAKRRAEAEEQRQRKAQETARKKAEAEEARRLKAEAIARKKAEEAAERKRIAQEKARIKAAQDAERKQQEVEAARIAAEKAKQQRLEDEKQARLRAEKAAAEKQQKELLRKQRAEEQAKQRKEKAEAARAARAAELEAKARAEEARNREREEALAKARELEEKAIERGARALTGKPSLKATQAKVKSRLELPRHGTAYHAGTAKRQPGAPNLYLLQAFRNTPAVRDRPGLSRQQMRKGLLTALGSLAIMLLLLGGFIGQQPGVSVDGPSGLATSRNGELAILAADRLLLHDRSGVAGDTVEAQQLGLRSLSPPMAYTASGKLLLRAAALEDQSGEVSLWRCDIEIGQCEPLSNAGQNIQPDSLRINPLTENLFIADARAGLLLKLGPDGELKSSRERTLPQRPAIQLDSGLLFINSTEGPAISVLRYEQQAFGQQLDEVLLLPPPALELNHTRVWDFATSGTHWWVTLYNPADGGSGLYLFDRDWNFVRSLTPTDFPHRGRLVNWGNKILLFSKHHPEVLRFSESGEEEARLVSSSLTEMIDERTGRRRLIDLGWQLSLLLSLAICLAGLAYAYLQSTRALVYKSRPTRGADPLDEIAGQIQWIDAPNSRSLQFRHATIGCAVLAVAVLIILIGLGVSLLQLVAAMFLLSGPLLALQILARSEREHLGIWKDQLVLADHRQMYHMAGGSRVQYRGPFVMIDDVIVFTGTALLPALNQSQIQSSASELIDAGVKVDRKTVLVKLMESRHPIARAGNVTAIGLTLGLVMAVLGSLSW
jgi:hypothetical protein